MGRHFATPTFHMSAYLVGEWWPKAVIGVIQFQHFREFWKDYDATFLIGLRLICIIMGADSMLGRLHMPTAEVLVFCDRLFTQK